MLKMLIEKLEMLGDDVAYSFDEKEHLLHITFDDFEGFDEDWEEVYRDYTHPELVDEVMDFLDEHCLSQEGDFYHYYDFGDFVAKVGYTSFDI